MQMRWVLVVGTTLFRTAPSRPISATNVIWRWLLTFYTVSTRPACSKLMRKIHVALNPGGRSAIAEYVPNPDRVSPPIAAAFSLTILAATASGDAYTFTELESIARLRASRGSIFPSRTRQKLARDCVPMRFLTIVRLCVVRRDSIAEPSEMTH
jgi:hypothetical protein